MGNQERNSTFNEPMSKSNNCSKLPNDKRTNLSCSDEASSQDVTWIIVYGLSIAGVVTAASLPVFGVLFGHSVSHQSASPAATHGLPPNESLFAPYVMDFHHISMAREENMEKYSYNYSRYGVDKRSKLSVEEFWDVYDGKWPVIITDIVPKWPAYNWSQEFFQNNYGQEQVTMKVVDFDLDNAISDLFGPLGDDLPDTKQKQSCLESAVGLVLPLELFHHNFPHAQPHRWTYIEDELFIHTRPQLRKDIGHCPHMEEDYFQLFPEEVRPWNAMLLWGTQYSRSSLHIDPYNWTGTNAVIKGHKRWKLYPPGQDHFLSVINNKMSGFPLNCKKYNSILDAFEPDFERHPQFIKANAIEVDQFPGEMLFIPSGWFHQAFNMEETIAISSQLMNHNNYRIVLEEIFKAGSIDRRFLPGDIDNLDPPQQVDTIMKHLPLEVLQHGHQVTKNVIKHIENVNKQHLSVPLF